MIKKLIKTLSSSLTNEDNESFNFGVKDGVRGFYTNPSRADDSFIPFSNISTINDMDLLIEFTDRFPNFLSYNSSSAVGIITTDVFRQLKNFTFYFKTSGQPAYYLRTFDESGKMVENLEGWNSKTAGAYTFTVDCTKCASVNKNYTIALTFSSSYATLDEFKMLSYELL